MLGREELIEELRRGVEAMPQVNAAWLGGSDAFGASDAMSDVDLNLDVADDAATDVLDGVESILRRLSPIFARWIVPEPTWHGHRQRFYRLADAPETLLVDVLAMERSSTAMRFDEREHHGEPVVLFDRLGVARSRPLDRAAHDARMRERLDALRAREALFAGFAEKEARRGRTIDATWAYDAFVLTPLVEALRMRYCPERFHFGKRYLDRDLPPDVVARLVTLAFPRDLADLRAKAAEARAWLVEVLDAVSAAGTS